MLSLQCGACAEQRDGQGETEGNPVERREASEMDRNERSVCEAERGK